MEQEFALPLGCKVKFAFTPPDQLGYEITPTLPRFETREDVLSFVRDFDKARRQFLESVATATDLRIAVVDSLGDGREAISAPIAPAPRQ